MKKNSNASMIGVVGKEGYEAITGARALARAGKCSQLKGVVHEIMFCDKYNATPTNLLQGNHAALTHSTTARMKDVVMTNNGRVVGHAQLKDTVSPSGIRKTIEQINGGHYGKTSVIGTEETVERIAGKVSQPVRSSGISSETTSRIADKALGRMPTASALSSAVKSGGMAGAVVGGAIEAVSSVKDVLDGKKDVGDAVIDVGGAAVKGGITGAISAGAGTTAAGLTGAAVTSLASTGVGAAITGTAVGAAAVAAAPIAAGIGAACLLGKAVSSLFDW